MEQNLPQLQSSEGWAEWLTTLEFSLGTQHNLQLESREESRERWTLTMWGLSHLLLKFLPGVTCNHIIVSMKGLNVNRNQKS